MPGFYSLANAWLFLLIVPLVIFYFLKLKRPRLEIASLALWRQVINDQRVNSPFQKFKRNILLLLQLLLLCALVLAATQPFLSSGAERAEFLPVLIDCSASMAAVDKPGGQSRLDVAKTEIRKLIESMLPDQRLSLIAVHGTARRLTDFTNNKRVLYEALDRISVSDVPSKLEDALRMAQALSRTVLIEKVVIYSDGNFPAQVDFALPFELSYQKLPGAGANVGITAFNAQQSTPPNWDVFVRVEGSHQAGTSAKLQLRRDGKLLGEENVVLDAGQSQRLVFQVQSEKACQLDARLEPDRFDALDSDNSAYLDLPTARPLTVFASPELTSYRHALAALKGLAVFPEADGSSHETSFDLMITDNANDAVRDATVALFVGVIPQDLQSLIQTQSGLAQLVDWQRSSPLLQHMHLAEVEIHDDPKLSAGADSSDFEELGYEILAESRTGPLILTKRAGAKSAYYLLFHTDRSSLPFRVGFPILVSNAIQIALHEAALSEVRAAPTGVLPTHALAAKKSYQVDAPDGTSVKIDSDADGILAGVPAPRVGRYTIRDGGDAVAALGASLLNSPETALAAVEQIQFKELSVAASTSQIKSDRPLWPTLALVAFCCLLVEWWYFQRPVRNAPT